MKWGRILLCAKWHCIAWNEQVYSVVFFSVCFPKNVPEWRECKSQNSLFLWVTLPCVIVHTHCILGFCFVINRSCMLFLKQKSLWICLFVFLPSAMKAHVISCMSDVGHNIYNISTVLQLFFSAVVMQVFSVHHFEWHCFHDAYFADILYVKSPCSEQYLWRSYCEMACSTRQAVGDINLIGFIPLLLDIVPNI